MRDLNIIDWPDIQARAQQLGLPEVEPLALLPEGIEQSGILEVVINRESATLRKLFREAGVKVQVLGPAERRATVVRKSADLVLPVLYVGASLWSQNPMAVQIAIDVIASYVADALKGMRPARRLKLSVAVETTGARTTKLLTYEGPADGLDRLTRAIERIAREQ